MRGHFSDAWMLNFIIIFKLGYTSCKAEQPLQGINIKAKRLKLTGNLLRKSLKLKGVC